MSRKTLVLTIDVEGRDNGKQFHIREMPASYAEKWAIRAILAMGKTNVNIPEGLENAGFAALARLGLTALMQVPFQDLEPLLDEMMECVKIIPSPSNPNVMRDIIADDIEEISTLFKIRSEVFKLHADFFKAAA